MTGRWILKWAKRLALGGIAAFLLFLLLNWIFPVPDKVDYSTIITDNKGEVIHAYLTKDQQWRMKTELNEISPCCARPLLKKRISISTIIPA